MDDTLVETQLQQIAGMDSQKGHDVNNVNGIRSKLDKVNGNHGIKPTLHVECRLKTLSTCRFEQISEKVTLFIQTHMRHISSNEEITGFEDITFLSENVELLRTAERSDGYRELDYVANIDLKVHVYQVNEEASVDEFTEEGDIVSLNIWDLPSRGLEGLWESLVFDDDVTNGLLQYIYTTMLFSDHHIDNNIVSWNRLVLLHGPPGTGKTTLCKALGQKLAIRLSQRYTHGKLVEINSHSLFSKWFSESGKLVMKLFQQVTDLIEDGEAFVCVLIDEVESLTSARRGAISGSEPSDALRVVNALLTQLDKLRKQKNVLVLTTSNLVDAMDTAFLDRADVVQYIGLPSQAGIYNILTSCLEELRRGGIVTCRIDDNHNEATERTMSMHERMFLEYKQVQAMMLIKREFQSEIGADLNKLDNAERRIRYSLELMKVCDACVGLSGRFLRRLPVLAHARFIQLESGVDIVEYMKAMKKATLLEHGKFEKSV